MTRVAPFVLTVDAALANVIDRQLGFFAQSVMVDNYTEQYVYLPTVQRYIPPLTVGAIYSVEGEQRAQAAFLAPPALSSLVTATVVGQEVHLLWTDESLPQSGGVSIAPAASVWTPFGLLAPYTGAGVDTTEPVNRALTAQIEQFRDWTIGAGVVITAFTSPQIILVRTLRFGSASSEIRANGLGPPGATASSVGGGDTYAGNAQTPTTVGVIERLMSPGGSRAAPGGAGATPIAALVMLLVLAPQLVGIGGGGGGGGGAGGGSFVGSAGGFGPGGGGGGGLNAAATRVVAGGPGGGVVLIIADTILGAAGLVSANGSDGAAGDASNGGGGGGGGGAIFLYARKALATPVMQANGGAGGAGTPAGGAGGAGIRSLRSG